MKNEIILFVLINLIGNLSFSQDCETIDTTIDKQYLYKSSKDGFSIPVNKTWSIAMEDRKAIVAILTEKNQLGSIGIIKNKNGYKIPSAHNITSDMIDKLFKKAAINIESKTITKTYVRNIKALQVSFNYIVRNIDSTINMTGISFLIVKDFNTYVFMFLSPPLLKNCLFPFYKNIMKNAYFEPEWFGKNN